VEAVRERTRTDADVTAFYASFEWRRLRYSILLMYGRKCMCCGTTEEIMHVDHIKPLRFNWSRRLDSTNLQVLCAVCNHGKGNWDETDFRSVEPTASVRIRNYIRAAIQPFLDRRIGSQMELVVTPVDAQHIDALIRIYRGPILEIDLRYQIFFAGSTLPLPPHPHWVKIS
jgi:hypothetical protein